MARGHSRGRSIVDSYAARRKTIGRVPAEIDWLHIDLFAWNDIARPGRSIGGEAQTIRTLLAMLEARFGATRMTPPKPPVALRGVARGLSATIEREPDQGL